MKNQSDTFANSLSGLPNLQVEKKVETTVSNNHLDTKFTADEVYSAVWVNISRLHTHSHFPAHSFERNEYSLHVHSYHFNIGSQLHMKQTRMKYNWFFFCELEVFKLQQKVLERRTIASDRTIEIKGLINSRIVGVGYHTVLKDF